MYASLPCSSFYYLIQSPIADTFSILRHPKRRRIILTVNSRAKFTTHSRVMFTSDDRVDVYHINTNHADLAFDKASFLRESWR